MMKVAGVGALAMAITPFDILISSCKRNKANENNRAL